VTWNHNDDAYTTPVFGPAASPTSWTDIDISAKVGSNVVFALFAIKYTSGSDAINVMRGKDEDAAGHEYYDTQVQCSHGTTRGKCDHSDSESIALATLTDSSGVAQWRSQYSGTATVYLIGWLDVDTDNTNLVTGAWPAGWTAKDVSAIVGAAATFCIMRYHRTGGASATPFALRPGDEGDDCLSPYSNIGGVAQGGYSTNNIYSLVTMMTDATGTFDYRSQTAGPEGDLDMMAYAAMQTPTNARVFAAAEPPSADWAELDLTTGPDGATGLSGRCLVLLKFHHEVDPGWVRCATRPKGDSQEYLISVFGQVEGAFCLQIDNDDHSFLICETDADGVIEWKCGASGTPDDMDVELVGWVGSAAPPEPSQYVGPGGGGCSDISGAAKSTALTNVQGLVFHEDFINSYLVQRQRGPTLTSDGDLFSVPGVVTLDADNYITYPATQWPLGFGDGTIFFRATPVGISGLMRLFGTSSSVGDGDEWRTELVIEGPQLKFVAPIGGSARDGSAFAIALGTEFSAAVTFEYDSGADETDLVTYKDGALVGSATYSGRIVAPDQGWTIGRWNASEADATMRQLLMFNRVLSAESVADLHAQGGY